MEVIYYLIHYLLRLDERSLRPLRHWVPDFQEVLSNPKEMLRDRDVEIGPWNRRVRSFLIPVLLILPVFIVTALADLPAVTICSTLAWLIFTVLLVVRSRGGSCLLRIEGAEFRYRGVSAFCPWDVFHAAGQPMYYAEKHRLDIPVQPGAIAGMEVRKDDIIIGHGLETQASHVQILPAGEMRLKFVYGVNPAELGGFLLALGSRLGGPKQSAAEEAPALRPLADLSEKGDWIRVSLTRLRFPPLCCDCCQPTDAWQEFLGFKSQFSTDFSIGGDGMVKLTAPVCSHCQKANRGRYWRTLFKTTPLGVIGVTALCFVVGLVLDVCGVGADLTVSMVGLTFAVSLALSWFFTAKYAYAVSAPLSLSDYQPRAGTIRVRFRNSKYAGLFVSQLGR